MVLLVISGMFLRISEELKGVSAVFQAISEGFQGVPGVCQGSEGAPGMSRTRGFQEHTFCFMDVIGVSGEAVSETR